MTETKPTDALAAVAYGRLLEGAHLAGYTFERACFNLEWLLQEDRWRKVGPGFDDINEFLASVRLNELRTTAEARKRIAARIKELQPGASNRKIAAVLGVAHTTIDRDTGTNVPPTPKTTSKDDQPDKPGGTNVPPPEMSGDEVARMAQRKATGAADKVEHRAERERELADKVRALPAKKYAVIVADPEWRFEPWSRETGMDRAADNHYPTSCTDVIAARDVPSIAADDCVLFLWATIPMLPHALLVMAAWGFDYVSHYAWGKDKIGTGYWSREKHELLLIGTRGDVPCPAPGTQWDSLIMAPRGEHSEKPECFLAMIEGYYPNVPKIELNRRGPPRPGWDAWGNETEETYDEANYPESAHRVIAG